MKKFAFKSLVIASLSVSLFGLTGGGLVEAKSESTDFEQLIQEERELEKERRLSAGLEAEPENVDRTAVMEEKSEENDNSMLSINSVDTSYLPGDIIVTDENGIYDVNWGHAALIRNSTYC